MAVRAWLISLARSLRVLRASMLICALLLLSPQAALAQFSQDGPKLVGSGAVGASVQGFSASLSADGNTAIVGGLLDNNGVGAAWVFTRKAGIWTQQGSKLVGAGAVGASYQGDRVALSADGNTAIVSGTHDDSKIGAIWAFTRSGGVWTQQGSKLVGSGYVGTDIEQGFGVALSADGNTAIVGGGDDNNWLGATWVFTRKDGVWTQQGRKLVGSGHVGRFVVQGSGVAVSSDGNTAIVGGVADNGGGENSPGIGAAWVFTRSNGVWTQQGGKLVGTGAVGLSGQGHSVSLSADGDTAVVGGWTDNNGVGAAWIFTRKGGVWTQQGSKLVGAEAVGLSGQGASVALSADGDTAIVGGWNDNKYVGATWVFIRRNGVWTQQGGKLIGAGAVGASLQGLSASLSGDGDTAIEGGLGDNSGAGAAWVFVQPLQVGPYANGVASGTQGGPFSPKSFSYTLSATSGSVKYSISGVPSWLTASSTSGTVTTANKAVTFEINASADKLAPGTYVGAIAFNNADNAQQSISRAATLTVNPRKFTVTVEASPAADGTVSGGGAFAQGASVTVKAKADGGFAFLHWTEGGKVVSTSANYTFTVEANVTAVADFSKIK